MLYARLQTILGELMTSDEPVTGDYLANLNQVTDRTTRQDIKNLDSQLAAHGAGIHSIWGKGYALEITDNNKFRKYLQTHVIENASALNRVPTSPQERISYIIKRLLLRESYLKLDDLADEMYISRSTIQNDLKQVKEILRNYDIYLETRPNYGLKLVGSELKLRFCMAEYVFERKKGTCNQTTNLSFLPKQDLDTIHAIILKQIKANHITLSDIAINNLLIHIAIAFKRIKSGNHVSLVQKDIEEITGQTEYKVAQKMVSDLEDAFHVTFPKMEVAYTAIHLLGTKMLKQTAGAEKVVEHVMDENLLSLIMVALDKIKNEMNLDLTDDDELIIGLSLHLKPAINRYKYGMNIRNPMLTDIKKNYPLAYEAGVLAGMAIEEEAGTEMNESEVGYIALHIGAAIERKKMKLGPKRCLIVCASGLGTAKLIYYRLKNHFGKNLDVAGTTELYNLNSYDLRDFDFIVSSIPITEQLPVPVVQVNAIVNDHDLEKIESELVNHTQNMEVYFRENIMFLGKDFSTKKEVLAFLHEKLSEKGLVGSNLLQAINEREEVAPTSFGNLVAIPHPITPQSDQTFLSVCALKKPITWEDKSVQLICLLCVKKNSQEDLQSMYELLGKIIDSSTIVQKLVKAKTYTEFMRILQKEFPTS